MQKKRQLQNAIFGMVFYAFIMGAALVGLFASYWYEEETHELKDVLPFEPREDDLL